MEEITTVGIDLAKDVLAVCVLDACGAVLERKVLRRAAFERWAAALAPCSVAMEACGSAHHWGRFFAARGHTARLIAAEFVVPFRQGGRNDGNDALAIAIAARQPTTRFVPIKTAEQQAILSWHRARAGFKQARTHPVGDAGARSALRSERVAAASAGNAAGEDRCAAGQRLTLKRLRPVIACRGQTERGNTPANPLARTQAAALDQRRRRVAAERIGIPRATRMVARVGQHDATRPVAQMQSTSCRQHDPRAAKRATHAR